MVACFAMITVVAAVSAPRVAMADARGAGSATAKAHLGSAARAARALRWDEALTEYTAAEAASPSPEAMLGIAEAHDALRHDVDAYNAFHDLLAAFGARLSSAQAATANARLAALEHVTGLVSVTVNVGGAALTIDDAPAGVAPLPAAVRMTTGLHRVRATLPGYADAEALPTVVGGQTAMVVLSLKEATRTGHVSVRTGDAIPATLRVDGKELGPLPWEGDLAAGPHDIFVHGATKASSHQTVEVLRGQSQSLILQLNVIETAVSVTTADRNGRITLDGAAMGDGAWSGKLPIGEHELRITRDGYDPVDKRIVLHEGESYAETFILTPVGAGALPSPEASRPLEGVVGGAMLAGAFQVNGLNGDFSEPCSFASTPSPTSCSAGSPAGGAILGYVGYTANPVGVDVLFGGQLDTASVAFTVQGGKQVSESFTTPRIGGLIAPRARVTGQTSGFRFSFAAGVGLAVREVSLSSHGLSAITGSDPSSTYVAPAITFEGTVHVRVTPRVALGAGLMYWAESAGNGVTLASGPYLTQPAVVLSAVQAMVLPFVGLELGP